MKQPKKLTRIQKEFLARKGFAANEWALLEETADSYVFIHKARLEVKTFLKD